MLVCVKELWSRTDKCEMVVSKWHGWVLAYLTRKCFPGVTIKSDSNNPMQPKFVSSIPKLLEKLNIEIGSTFDYERLGDMFVDHEHVCVINNSVFSNTRVIDDYVSEEDDVIIVIYDEVDLENELHEELEVN